MTSLPVLSCDGCSACCGHVGYPPLVPLAGDPDWDRLTEVLQAEIDEALSTGRGDGGLPCIWLDEHSNRCRHYELRPAVCRKFERGGAACLSFREGNSCS